MSQWSTLEARFAGCDVLADDMVRQDMPTGSESGPTIDEHDASFYVDGRLRDMGDHESPAVLAWFLSVAAWCDTADLTWDVDSGPRYRYEWRDGTLVKLRGVLDA